MMRAAVMCVECVECGGSGSVCQRAAERGHLGCLTAAHEGSGEPLDPLVCTLAAKGGHLECLRYAHRHGAPLGGVVCFMAAWKGHLGCLRYAHENGAAWNGLECTMAVLGGHLGCLEFAHVHGAEELDNGGGGGLCGRALEAGHMDCLLYAYTRGARLARPPSGGELRQDTADMLAATRRVGWAAGALGRMWRERRRRAQAATKIADAWLRHCYRPGGPGCSRVLARLARGQHDAAPCLSAAQRVG